MIAQSKTTSQLAKVCSFLALAVLMTFTLNQARADGENPAQRSRETGVSGTEEGQRRVSPEAQGGIRKGPREGDGAVRRGSRDGEGVAKAGPRDGEGGVRRGPRDGERPAGMGPRETGARRPSPEAQAGRRMPAESGNRRSAEGEGRHTSERVAENRLVIPVNAKGQVLSSEGQVLSQSDMRAELGRIAASANGRRIYVQAEQGIATAELQSLVKECQQAGIKNLFLSNGRR